MKKIILVIVALLIISGCKKNELVQESNENIKNQILQEISNENISISTTSSDSDGTYKGLTLSIKGTEFYFDDWVNNSSANWMPQLILSDIDNNGTEELIVILTEGTGTGVHIEKIHLFNMNTLTEIMVPTIQSVISDNIETSISPSLENDKYVITTIKLNEETYKYSALQEGKSWLKNVNFENICKYYVSEDNELYAEIGAQTTFSEFIGSVVIKFNYVNNTVVVKLIELDDIDTSNYKIVEN